MYLNLCNKILNDENYVLHKITVWRIHETRIRDHLVNKKSMFVSSDMSKITRVGRSTQSLIFHVEFIHHSFASYTSNNSYTVQKGHRCGL